MPSNVATNLCCWAGSRKYLVMNRRPGTSPRSVTLLPFSTAMVLTRTWCLVSGYRAGRSW